MENQNHILPQILKERPDEVGQLTRILEETFEKLRESSKNVKMKNEALITEIDLRENAEKQLERMTELLANSEDAIFIADKDFKLQYTNKSFDLITESEKIGSNRSLTDCGFELSVDIKEALLFENTWTGEMNFQNIEGKNHVIQLFLSYMKQENECYLGILRI